MTKLCKREAIDPRVKTCPSCGETFTARHGKQKYCSRTCVPHQKSPEYAWAEEALRALKSERRSQPAVYRAPSLATAGETPAHDAAHRDCLTGAASATVHRGGHAAGGMA